MASALPQRPGETYSRSPENKIYAYLDRMPLLVATLRELSDDVHIIGSNYFCSEPTDPKAEAHGEWHSGHSLYFGVRGAAMTLWIPLQDLAEKTGGCLKIYNGRYISQMDDLLKCQVRHTGNSIVNKQSILGFLNHELEAGAKVENVFVCDALLFDEMLPHQAEKCYIQREVLAVRLVLGDYALDRELIEKVLARYKNVPGEIPYGAEYLRNLLKLGEYREPGSSGRPDRSKEPLPGEASLWQRARRRLVRTYAPAVVMTCPPTVVPVLMREPFG